PIAALLRDLKASGMLEDTLVIFCGEFGRTSYCEGPMSFESYGRDHQQLCGGMLLIGGGFPGGFFFRGTSEGGLGGVERPGPHPRRSSNGASCARPRSPPAGDALPGP